MFKWLKKLFSKKEKATVEVKVEPVVEEKVEVKEEAPVVEEKVEKPVEVPVAIAEDPQCIALTEEEKDHLSDILRPIVKAYNGPEKGTYSTFMKDVEILKTLKVFGKLVDDNLLIVYKFTQSDEYNEKMENFVRKVVVKAFREAVEKDEACKNLIITSADGKIKVRKVEK